MKRKNNNKVKAFLSKYQLGGDYDMQDPYNYTPDLQTAQQQQIVQFNQPQDQMAYQAPQQNPFNTLGVLPFIGPAINLGIGVKSIIDSFGQRKRQKQYERAYKKDLDQRMEQNRIGNYVNTPYANTWGNFQLGGTSEQMGVLDPYEYSDMDDFLSYYNQKENQNQIQQQKMQQWYETNNQNYENQWRTNQSQGIQNALSGAIGLASMFQKGGLKDTLMQRNSTQVNLPQNSLDYASLFSVDDSNNIDSEHAMFRWNLQKENPEMFNILIGRDSEYVSKRKPSFRDRFHEKQDGGEIEYNPKTDLYSPEYDPNEFLGIVKDEVELAQQEDQLESLTENWLFDDTDPYQEEMTDRYLQGNEESSGTYQPARVIDKIGSQESAGDYNAINPYSGAVGKYQFVPSHWSGQIKSYLGLPQSYTREQVMDTFKRNPQAQEDFMQWVTESIYKPEVEKLRPLAQKYNLDDDKLIRMLHYRGLGDTRRRLESGDFSVSQSEKDKYKNPDVLTYLNK